MHVHDAGIGVFNAIGRSVSLDYRDARRGRVSALISSSSRADSQRTGCARRFFTRGGVGHVSAAHRPSSMVTFCRRVSPIAPRPLTAAPSVAASPSISRILGLMSAVVAPCEWNTQDDVSAVLYPHGRTTHTHAYTRTHAHTHGHARSLSPSCSLAGSLLLPPFFTLPLFPFYVSSPRPSLAHVPNQ
jgi:hypothetical protein